MDGWMNSLRYRNDRWEYGVRDSFCGKSDVWMDGLKDA